VLIRLAKSGIRAMHVWWTVETVVLQQTAVAQPTSPVVSFWVMQAQASNMTMSKERGRTGKSL
jgi:hypothetical protein